jgi:tetratricopeptide (TPR) repeat protein
MPRGKFWLLLSCLVAVAVAPYARATAEDATAKAAAVQSEVEKARQALAAQRFKEAIGLAKEAIATAGSDKSAAPAYEVLANALYQTKDANGAVAALKQALQIDRMYGPAYVSLGGIAFSEGHLPEARQYLEQALKIDPSMLAAHERLGLVLQGMGDPAGAIREYELGLLTTKPDYAGAKVNLGELYVAAGRPADAVRLLEPLVKPGTQDKRALLALANAYLESGQAKQAVPLYSSALLYDRRDMGVALALGTAQRMAGLNAAALDQLQQVTKNAPDSGMAWYQLGLTYAALQRYADAKPAFVKAIEIDPKSILFRLALGDTMLAAHEPGAALAVFQEITRSDAAGLPAYDGIAQAYVALERPTDAEVTYRDAVARFGKDPQVYARLGAMLVQHGKYEEALKVLGEGSQLAPDDPNLLGNTALAQWRAGHLADGVATARRLVDSQRGNMNAKLLLGTLLDANGDKAQEIALYREVLAENPNNAQALNNLASSLTDTGEVKAAVPLARQAMTLWPDNADVTDTLGWALLKSGQTTEALTMLKTASALRPRDALLMYHLAVAEKEAGDPQAARATLVNALAMPGEFKEAPAARALLGELSK